MVGRILIALIACLLTTPPAAAGKLYVIVAGDSRVKRISRQQLAHIYLKKIQIDDRGRRWIPLNLEAASRFRRAFSRALFKQFPEEMGTYWNIQYFQGVSPPYVVGSEEAMVSFVADTPGAIGYIPPCQRDDRVKVVLTLTVDAPTRNACQKKSSK